MALGAMEAEMALGAKETEMAHGAKETAGMTRARTPTQVPPSVQAMRTALLSPQ